MFPGVLLTEQKHIGKWREAIEAEMNIRHSETYRRPSVARYLVGCTLALMCKSRYPVHFVAVDVKSTRTIVHQAFSVPKCVKILENSYELLYKIISAVPDGTKEELESILGKKFMGYVVVFTATIVVVFSPFQCVQNKKKVTCVLCPNRNFKNYVNKRKRNFVFEFLSTRKEHLTWKINCFNGLVTLFERLNKP